MARKRSPARLIVALSVAAALAVFLLYTALAGDTLAALKPSQLSAKSGRVPAPASVSNSAKGTKWVASRFFSRGGPFAQSSKAPSRGLNA